MEVQLVEPKCLFKGGFRFFVRHNSALIFLFGESIFLSLRTYGMITILLAKLKAYGVGERSFILYYLLGRQHRVKKKKNI